jgi:hypothetical protein
LQILAEVLETLDVEGYISQICKDSDCNSLVPRIIWKPELCSSYKKKSIFSTGSFYRIIPDNILVLLKLLHFVDSNNVPQSTNKMLNNVQPAFHYVNRKFSEVYTPTQNLAMYERLTNALGSVSGYHAIHTYQEDKTWNKDLHPI